MAKLSQEQRSKNLIAQKKWREKNKDKIKEYQKHWNSNNVEHKQKYKRNWDMENKDKKLESNNRFKQKNPDYHKNKHLKSNYGITLDEYNLILSKQGFCCDVCGKKPEDTSRGRLFVDHNHESGVIRGLLCQQCNTALGMVNDNIEVLYKLVSYLQKNEEELIPIKVGE